LSLYCCVVMRRAFRLLARRIKKTPHAHTPIAPAIPIDR